MTTRYEQDIKAILGRISYMMGHYGKSNPALMDDLRRLYGQVKSHELNLDVAIEELSQMYLRNGSFPGDMVGWSDDDLIEDDDTDDEDEA